MRWLGPALGLGLAGFDPLGAIVFMAAMAAGARRAALTTLGVTTVATTSLLGLLAVLGLGPTIHRWEERLHPSSFAWHMSAMTVGAGLLAWGVRRLTHRDRSEGHDSTPPRSLTAAGLAWAGLAVGGSSLLDPAWYAMVAYAARLSPGSAAATAVVWTLLSHVALVALTVAVVMGAHEPVQRGIDATRDRYGTAFGRGMTGLVVISGAALIGWGLTGLL